MRRFNRTLATVLLTCGAICSHSASAQSPMSYEPQSPTVSPWLGLWRQNTGALDNYHTFVQPQMELNRTLQMQNSALTRQAAGLQSLHNEIMQPQGNQSGMMPTGQGSTFMNYSHYYGGNRQILRPAPARLTAQRTAPNLPSVTGMPH